MDSMEDGEWLFALNLNAARFATNSVRHIIQIELAYSSYDLI